MMGKYNSNLLSVVKIKNRGDISMKKAILLGLFLAVVLCGFSAPVAQATLIAVTFDNLNSGGGNVNQPENLGMAIHRERQQHCRNQFRRVRTTITPADWISVMASAFGTPMVICSCPPQCWQGAVDPLLTSSAMSHCPHETGTRNLHHRGDLV